MPWVRIPPGAPNTESITISALQRGNRSSSLLPVFFVRNFLSDKSSHLCYYPSQPLNSARALFQTILRGEFNISGLQNKSLRRFLPHLNSGQVSRLLKRLRLHGLIKKVARTYKYYVPKFGKDVSHRRTQTPGTRQERAHLCEPVLPRRGAGWRPRPRSRHASSCDEAI